MAKQQEPVRLDTELSFDERGGHSAVKALGIAPCKVLLLRLGQIWRSLLDSGPGLIVNFAILNQSAESVAHGNSCPFAIAAPP